MSEGIKTVYVDGQDLLLKVAGKAVGHCTSHTTTYNSETKERAVKPLASAATSTAKFKNKIVTGMSVSVKFEGLSFYGETENGFKQILAEWAKGQSVQVEAFERGSDETPYMSGKFIIQTLERQAPAGDDVTYTGTLENDGPVTTDTDKIS